METIDTSVANVLAMYDDPQCAPDIIRDQIFSTVKMCQMTASNYLKLKQHELCFQLLTRAEDLLEETASEVKVLPNSAPSVQETVRLLRQRTLLMLKSFEDQRVDALHGSITAAHKRAAGPLFVPASSPKGSSTYSSKPPAPVIRSPPPPLRTTTARGATNFPAATDHDYMQSEILYRKMKAPETNDDDVMKVPQRRGWNASVHTDTENSDDNGGLGEAWRKKVDHDIQQARLQFEAKQKERRQVEEKEKAFLPMSSSGEGQQQDWKGRTEASFERAFRAQRAAERVAKHMQEREERKREMLEAQKEQWDQDYEEHLKEIRDQFSVGIEAQHQQRQQLQKRLTHLQEEATRRSAKRREAHETALTEAAKRREQIRKAAGTSTTIKKRLQYDEEPKKVEAHDNNVGAVVDGQKQNHQNSKSTTSRVTRKASPPSGKKAAVNTNSAQEETQENGDKDQVPILLTAKEEHEEAGDEGQVKPAEDDEEDDDENAEDSGDELPENMEQRNTMTNEEVEGTPILQKGTGIALESTKEGKPNFTPPTQPASALKKNKKRPRLRRHHGDGGNLLESIDYDILLHRKFIQEKREAMRQQKINQEAQEAAILLQQNNTDQKQEGIADESGKKKNSVEEEQKRKALRRQQLLKAGEQQLRLEAEEQQKTNNGTRIVTRITSDEANPVGASLLCHQPDPTLSAPFEQVLAAVKIQKAWREFAAQQVLLHRQVSRDFFLTHTIPRIDASYTICRALRQFVAKKKVASIQERVEQINQMRIQLEQRHHSVDMDQRRDSIESVSSPSGVYFGRSEHNVSYDSFAAVEASPKKHRPRKSSVNVSFEGEALKFRSFVQMRRGSRVSESFKELTGLDLSMIGSLTARLYRIPHTVRRNRRHIDAYRKLQKRIAVRKIQSIWRLFREFLLMDEAAEVQKLLQFATNKTSYAVLRGSTAGSDSSSPIFLRKIKSDYLSIDGGSAKDSVLQTERDTASATMDYDETGALIMRKESSMTKVGTQQPPPSAVSSTTRVPSMPLPFKSLKHVCLSQLRQKAKEDKEKRAADFLRKQAEARQLHDQERQEQQRKSQVVCFIQRVCRAYLHGRKLCGIQIEERMMDVAGSPMMSFRFRGNSRDSPITMGEKQHTTAQGGGTELHSTRAHLYRPQPPIPKHVYEEVVRIVSVRNPYVLPQHRAIHEQHKREVVALVQRLLRARRSLVIAKYIKEFGAAEKIQKCWKTHRNGGK